MTDEKRSYERRNRRAPRGAYAIRWGGERSNSQYVLTVPRNIAKPLHDASMAVVYEVVDEGILLRPVPMTTEPETDVSRKMDDLLKRSTSGPSDGENV